MNFVLHTYISRSLSLDTALVIGFQLLKTSWVWKLWVFKKKNTHKEKLFVCNFLFSPGGKETGKGRTREEEWPGLHQGAERD